MRGFFPGFALLCSSRPSLSLPLLLYTPILKVSYEKVFMSKFYIYTHTRLYFTFYRTRMILIFQMSRKSIYSVLRKNTSSCGLLHNRYGSYALQRKMRIERNCVFAWLKKRAPHRWFSWPVHPLSTSRRLWQRGRVGDGVALKNVFFSKISQNFEHLKHVPESSF